MASTPTAGGSLSDDIRIRRATPQDAAVVARHRAAMFLDMGSTVPAMVDRLVEDTERYLREAMPRDEYVGWLAHPEGRPREVMAGAGVQVRRTLPFPLRRGDGSPGVGEGRQGIVLNVYTRPEHRRRGLARRLMQEVLAWAGSAGLESLVLHAAPAGRRIYERLGFVQTNEMRFTGDLSATKTAPGS